MQEIHDQPAGINGTRWKDNPPGLYAPPGRYEETPQHLRLVKLARWKRAQWHEPGDRPLSGWAGLEVGGSIKTRFRYRLPKISPRGGRMSGAARAHRDIPPDNFDQDR
jgi:hypothetical protein